MSGVTTGPIVRSNTGPIVGGGSPEDTEPAVYQVELAVPGVVNYKIELAAGVVDYEVQP